MKLDDVAVKRPFTKKGNRFFTLVDMAMLKKDTAIKNREILAIHHATKIPIDILRKYQISRCTCGVEGCFALYDNMKMEEPYATMYSTEYNKRLKYFKNDIYDIDAVTFWKTKIK